jgi:hypothetical protein
VLYYQYFTRERQFFTIVGGGKSAPERVPAHDTGIGITALAPRQA